MFNLFKKKKEAAEEIELPPPPRPPEAASMPVPEIEEEQGMDFPEIRPSFPEFPEMPEEEIGLEKEFDFERFKAPAPEEFSGPAITGQGFPELPAIEEEFDTPEKVFDRTIKEVSPRREEILRPREIKPLFVSVNDFANLAANTNFIRAKLVEADEYLQRLTDLKNQELKSFDTWKKTLENVEQKLAYVDQVIAKAQG